MVGPPVDVFVKCGLYCRSEGLVLSSFENEHGLDLGELSVDFWADLYRVSVLHSGSLLGVLGTYKVEYYYVVGSFLRPWRRIGPLFSDWGVGREI